MNPTSCDTFVVLPPFTKNNAVVFGKNSDRPAGEVQEIIHQPSLNHNRGSRIQCTYLALEQASASYAVVLSKPSWMWGAEMGANEMGVCIGNEAVWTKLNGPQDSQECLLGMDLVRLGLERGGTAREALDVITSFLTNPGQGGPCSDLYPDLTYHNSFLIADFREAWVLETADKLWAAQRITDGFRNISNCLSIGTEIDLCSEDLREQARNLGLWDGKEPFHFAKIFGQGGDDTSRYECGRRLLSELTSSRQFSQDEMFKVLRDKSSGICMSSGSFISTSSQVSVLTSPESKRPCCHWFTGTPDPGKSVFKPFIFCDGVRGSPNTISPAISNDPAKVRPRFQRTVDRSHALYKHHRLAKNRNDVLRLESGCVRDVEAFLDSCAAGDVSVEEARDLFKDVVESEIKLYK